MEITYRESEDKPALADTTPMVSVTDGRKTIGFVLTRLRVNGYAVTYEAFSADEKCLGLYQSQAEAANACWRFAHGQALQGDSAK